MIADQMSRDGSIHTESAYPLVFDQVRNYKTLRRNCQPFESVIFHCLLHIDNSLLYCLE
jgi:hypothetical protein